MLQISFRFSCRNPWATGGRHAYHLSTNLDENFTELRRLKPYGYVQGLLRYLHDKGHMSSSADGVPSQAASLDQLLQLLQASQV